MVITKKTVAMMLSRGVNADAEALCVALCGPHRNGTKSDSYGPRHIYRASKCLSAIEREDFARQQTMKVKATKSPAE